MTANLSLWVLCLQASSSHCLSGFPPTLHISRQTKVSLYGELWLVLVLQKLPLNCYCLFTVDTEHRICNFVDAYKRTFATDQARHIYIHCKIPIRLSHATDLHTKWEPLIRTKLWKSLDIVKDLLLHIKDNLYKRHFHPDINICNIPEYQWLDSSQYHIELSGMLQ